MGWCCPSACEPEPNSCWESEIPWPGGRQGLVPALLEDDGVSEGGEGEEAGEAGSCKGTGRALASLCSRCRALCVPPRAHPARGSLREGAQGVVDGGARLPDAFVG